MTAAPIQVGLAGFGVAGRFFHAPVISAVPGLRLAAIVQRTGDSAALAYPGARTVRSLDELLAVDDVQLVVIATPNATHGEFARRCLQAGRHVVVDKPFASSSSEAAAVVAAARRHARLLSVFQNRRYDGDFLTVQRLQRDGALGRVVLFESHFDRYRPEPKRGSWKERAGPGGGLLFDLGPHLVDQAVTLFGPPAAITADVRLEREGAVADDAFDVLLHYPGTRALLRATMLASEPGPRFVVRGTRATFVKHGMDPQEERLKGGEAPAGDDWGRDPAERWGTLTRGTAAGPVSEKVKSEAGDYRRYYANVRDAILGRAALAVTGEQALDVVRLLEIAMESSAAGRTVRVTL